MGAQICAIPPLPDWVPISAQHYLAHTSAQLSIRALARLAGVHASTILRQVRRYETRRDDPLIDAALRDLSRIMERGECTDNDGDNNMNAMTQDGLITSLAVTESELQQEAARVLRRMAEQGALLAFAKDMEKGVVVREAEDGSTIRLAVVDSATAQAMALKDWIQCQDGTARICRYHITGTGRSALKDFVAEAENLAVGFAEDAARFEQGDRDPLLRVSAALPESPLAGLSRRRGRNGKAFLSRDLAVAGERLREDYEVCQIEGMKPADWSSILQRIEDAQPEPELAPEGSAKRRVYDALLDLGAGLGDVALRTCCMLEGMETLEREMGWSARSGKIVLRIALQRLQKHYERTGGALAPKIG